MSQCSLAQFKFVFLTLLKHISTIYCVKEMSNFWLGKWSHPQIKPELAFAGFYLASLECYWKSMFQTKAYIGFLGQTFPGLAPQGLVWIESGDCGLTLITSAAVLQTSPQS